MKGEWVARGCAFGEAARVTNSHDQARADAKSVLNNFGPSGGKHHQIYMPEFVSPYLPRRRQLPPGRSAFRSVKLAVALRCVCKFTTYHLFEESGASFEESGANWPSRRNGASLASRAGLTRSLPVNAENSNTPCSYTLLRLRPPPFRTRP